NQSFDHLLSGRGEPTLLLPEYPILSVTGVRGDPTVALQIKNNSNAHQRATARVTSTGITLTRIAAAVVTTDTISFVTYPTLVAALTAITALGNGWMAQTTGTPDKYYPSADLRGPQGSLNALNTWANFYIHVTDIGDYDIDEGCGFLIKRDNGWGEGGV